MIYFYKDSITGLYYINGKYVPTGSCTLGIYQNNTVIDIKSINNELIVLEATRIVDLYKENDSAYTDLADLLTGVGDFFF